MAYAIVYTELGGPEVLHRIEIPDPVPAEGQLALRVEAVGVNPIDAKLRAGIRPSPPIDEPRRVGSDGAGIVTAVGDGVDGFRVGDAVGFWGASGAYASDVTVSARRAVPRPARVSALDAAALGIPIGTAYQTLRSLAVGHGDTLLVHGGSGSVGQAIVQFAVLWGARVIATSSERRSARVRELGGEPVVYGEGLADRVRAVAPTASPSRSMPREPTKHSRPPSSSSPTRPASRRSCEERTPSVWASARSAAARRGR